MIGLWLFIAFQMKYFYEKSCFLYQFINRNNNKKEICTGIFTSDLVWFNVDPVSFAKTPFEGKAVFCPVHFQSLSI